MKVLTIVPARSGSKGLLGKNIKTLIDKPLLAWSIEQGLACKYVDEVIVSTDSEEIADIAKQYGARIPFLRPADLAKDETSTADVLIHLIAELEKIGETYDYLLLLEPTSPLRETSDIENAFKKLLETPNAKSIVGVSKVESQHPMFCVNLTEDGFLQSVNDFKVLRRQEIEPVFYYEGSLYISDIHTYKAQRNFYHNYALGYIMPKWKSFEIDDQTDFLICETLLQFKLSNYTNEQI